MTRFKPSIFTLAAVAAIASSAMLVACGGGGGGADAASDSGGADSSSALSVNGTITGFGSVIIDGQKFDDSAASVSIDTNPAAPASATLSDLKLGMQVEGKVKAGLLTDVVMHASARGSIGAVNVAGSSFTIYQQTVSVVSTGPTPTVFEGVSGLAALAAGDVVEVHGSVDANKQIVATRVERKAPTDLAGGVRLGGLVTGLNATAKTFKLGELVVDFSAASVLPASKALADGQMVAVYADKAPTAGGALLAKGVKITVPEEGGTVDIGGRIMAFASVADFTVSGLHINASAATFDGGTAADLALGVAVAAEGKITAGVLKAAKLRVLKTAADVNASLAGNITDFVTSASFKVRGAPVDASAASFTGGTAADLGNGANVKVTGKVKGDLLKADAVEFTAVATTGATKLKGEVREFDPRAGTFHFLGVNLVLGTGVEYVGGSASDLANGKRVEITGTATKPAATNASSLPTLTVSKIEFLGELAAQVSIVSGRIGDLIAGGFKLPGVAVLVSSATSFSGGEWSDLANGVEVLVTGVWNAQKQALVATMIEVRKSSPTATGVAVAGSITDFVSVSAFRIGQQKVDASAATFVGGTAADLANGKAVEGAGVLAGAEGARYVKLAAVRFLK